MLYCVSFHLLCELSDYTVVGTALGPTLTMGKLAIGLGVSQTLFSFLFFITYLFIYWLHQVLVAAHEIFHCSVWALHCGVWASL